MDKCGVAQSCVVLCVLVLCAKLSQVCPLCPLWCEQLSLGLNSSWAFGAFNTCCTAKQLEDSS